MAVSVFALIALAGSVMAVLYTAHARLSARRLEGGHPVFDDGPGATGESRIRVVQLRPADCDTLRAEWGGHGLDDAHELYEIRPRIRNGKPAGFAIGRVPSNSGLAVLGVRSGDVIRAVNDWELDGRCGGSVFPSDRQDFWNLRFERDGRDLRVLVFDDQCDGDDGVTPGAPSRRAGRLPGERSEWRVPRGHAPGGPGGSSVPQILQRVTDL